MKAVVAGRRGLGGSCYKWGRFQFETSTTAFAFTFKFSSSYPFSSAVLYENYSFSCSIGICYCMAANSFKGRVVAGSLGKRLANQIWTAKSCDPTPFPISRRASHFSSHYEKDIEEHVRPAVVPDYVIDGSSNKYWGPHPTTGVFGPADLKGAAAVSLRPAPVDGNGGSSALDLTVRFRPLDLEDLDKSHQE